MDGAGLFLEDVYVRGTTEVPLQQEMIMMGKPACHINASMARIDLSPDNIDFSQFNFSDIGTPHNRDPAIVAVKVSAYVFMTALSLLGNTVVIWVVSRNQRMQTTTNFYLVNLACADLAICLCCMWVQAVKDITIYYVLGEFFCKLNAYAQMIANVASVLTLMAISCDRLVAVLYPLKARLTQHHASRVILAIWLLSGILATPKILSTRYTERQWSDFLEKNCFEEWPMEEKWDEEHCAWRLHTLPLRNIYYGFMSSVFFFLPVLIMTAAYSLITHRLKVTVLPGEQEDRALNLQAKAKRKVIKLVFTVVVVFTLCWMPLQVVILYDLINKGQGDQLLPPWFSQFIYFANFLALSNSAFNPIIYGGFNKSFRYGFLQAFGCRRGHQRYSTCMTNHNHSNQWNTPPTGGNQQGAGVAAKNRCSTRIQRSMSYSPAQTPPVTPVIQQEMKLIRGYSCREPLNPYNEGVGDGPWIREDELVAELGVEQTSGRTAARENGSTVGMVLMNRNYNS